MIPSPSKSIECDVLVVGGGPAGCWAALRAKELVPRVILVDKGAVGRSGSAPFCHDILASPSESELDAWLKEIVEHAEYVSDPLFLKVLLTEHHARLKQLKSWGVPFERDQKGEVILSLGRGHQVCRSLLCNCRYMLETLKEQVFQRGVEVINRVSITDLLTSDGLYPTRGRVTGALGIDCRSGGLFLFKAKVVVLASGICSFKLRLGYADNLTGDAQAMAFRAGAELSDLEFGGTTAFRIVSAGKPLGASVLPLQALGAHLVNVGGDRYMETYLPERMERRSTLGVLAQAWAKEILAGRGPVSFDLRHFSAEEISRLRTILPATMTALDQAGLDPSRMLLRCRPVLSALHGGIRINLRGETNVPGLLAAGYCAQFPGAAEGITGVMLAVCGVFGYKAGEQAAKVALEVPESPLAKGQIAELAETILAPLRRRKGRKPLEIYARFKDLFFKPDYGIVKSNENLNKLLELNRLCRGEDLPYVYAEDVHRLVQANEARNFLGLLEAFCIAVLERKESRLSHYRVEYPYRDDVDWLVRLVLKVENGNISVRKEPIPLPGGPINRPPPRRIPCPVKF